MKYYLVMILLVCLMGCDNSSLSQHPDKGSKPAVSDSSAQQNTNGVTPSPDTSSKKGY